MRSKIQPTCEVAMARMTVLLIGMCMSGSLPCPIRTDHFFPVSGQIFVTHFWIGLDLKKIFVGLAENHQINLQIYRSQMD